MSSGKRGPSVLVTDSRSRQSSRGPPPRQPGQSSLSGRAPMRLTVDNVLQYASDIPSAQPRQLPLPNRGGPSSAGGGGGGGSGTMNRRASGGLPTLQSRTGQPMPSRTTKVSEKLVLLPETSGGDGDGDDDDDDDDDDVDDDVDEDNPSKGPADQVEGHHRPNKKKHQDIADTIDGTTAGPGGALRRLVMDDDAEQGPLRDEELDVLRKRGGIRGKTYAERLPKIKRTEKLSRVTAYCVAQAFKLKETAEFLRKSHEAKTKLYDDCLYVIYALPLLPGSDGVRVRSRPILRTPGTGKTVIDLEIERSEQSDHHHEGYFDEYAFGPQPESPTNSRKSPVATVAAAAAATADADADASSAHHHSQHTSSDSNQHDGHGSPMNGIMPDAKNFAEVFIFSYGTAVFWNFTEQQEKFVLADLTFAGSEGGQSLPPSTTTTTTYTPWGEESTKPALSMDGDDTSGIKTSSSSSSPPPSSSLMTRPLDQDDFETEEFHFEYSSKVRRPRVFNDMITLLPRSDHMVKLTISHAISQSTKLCLFEGRLSDTMLSAQHVPKTLALTGELNMSRTEIVKIMGRLFTSRVDINLSSNILDVPNFFWESEPTLHPLYVAIREYLEIDPRIKVLNERCRVFLDLAEILSDSVNDAKMSAITWIIIILIVVSICVTVMEVGLRFGLLSRKDKDDAAAARLDAPRVLPSVPAAVTPTAQQETPHDVLRDRLQLPDNVSLDDLRRWSAMLVAAEPRAHDGASHGAYSELR